VAVNNPRILPGLRASSVAISDGDPNTLHRRRGFRAGWVILDANHLGRARFYANPDSRRLELGTFYDEQGRPIYWLRVVPPSGDG
jgi:hypothetical protein